MAGQALKIQSDELFFAYLHCRPSSRARMPRWTCATRAVRGAVFDVPVDIRKASAMFGEWVGVQLSEDNHRQLWVQPGFAHGFVMLSETADFLYKIMDYYAPEYERSIAWNDPVIGIEWSVLEMSSLSVKDQLGLALMQADVF